MKTSRVHLTIHNQWGSVEHYWHFFMGYFFPLINFYDSLGRRSRTTEILVRSCGPMDRHLADLNWSCLKILDKKEHEALRAPARDDLCYIKVEGMDNMEHYQRKSFRKAVGFLEKCWKKAAIFAPLQSQLLLIERGDPDPFYLSDVAEIQSAGNLRRSIPNMPQILEHVQRQVGHADAVQLEKLPLRRQFELYRGAEAIVFQHGASMANLVFCRKGAKAVEILPETLQPEVREMARTLCQLMGLNYFRVPQDSAHSPVDPAVISSRLIDGGMP
jgi:hypothetical protein